MLQVDCDNITERLKEKYPRRGYTGDSTELYAEAKNWTEN